MDDSKFAADTKIDFRITGFKKKKVKERARELKKSVTEYIKGLIDNDLDPGS